MILINGCWVNALSDHNILRFPRQCKNQTVKSSQKSCRIRLLICPVTYSMPPLWYPRLLFSFILLNFCHIYESGRISILPMYRFLETDIGKQQKYERAIQASVDNTGNDLRHKINFENCVKNKSNLFIEHSL